MLLAAFLSICEQKPLGDVKVTECEAASDALDSCIVYIVCVLCEVHAVVCQGWIYHPDIIIHCAESCPL